jgi:general secretion pathway protein A
MIPLQPIENAPATTLTALPKAAETGLFSSSQGQSEMIALFEGQAKDDSLERLLTIWGVESPPPAGVIPCQYLKSYSLRCLSGKGNWDELRRYNYPVILRLATPRGATRQVLLRSLDGETATLDLAGRPVQTSLSLLDLVWTGDYLLFWRPQIPLDFIGPGYRGEAVKWLRQRLALAQGNSAPPEPLADFFDSALREQVQSFQQSHNLQMDGLVGARTMIYLTNLMPAPDVPFLTPPVTDKPR